LESQNIFDRREVSIGANSTLLVTSEAIASFSQPISTNLHDVAMDLPLSAAAVNNTVVTRIAGPSGPVAFAANN
jgi:hypothetical protein